MLKFIIRLDDATSKMNHDNWKRVEALLDHYNIKPIVGVIPLSQDPLFQWEEDTLFWNKVQMWQEKGWTIAQHGCHHVYHDCGDGVRSEFIGLDYQEQLCLINKGYSELQKHGINPICFFAPAHTFDDITVRVCKDSGYFQFISDGYALYPYVEAGMLFVPSIFDTAHKIIPFGVYTFILHPSFLTEHTFEHFDRFIKNNLQYFESVPDILMRLNLRRKKTCVEQAIEPTIKMIRRIRKITGDK